VSQPTAPSDSLDVAVAAAPAAPRWTAAPEPAPEAVGAVGTVAGIVLAGSHVWSDDPVQRLLRSPVLPLAHVPLICHPLMWLRAGGLDEAVVCAGRANADVHAAVGTHTADGLALEYYTDIHPRGPAGCARDALALVDADTLVIVEGTLIPVVSLADLLESHRRTRADVTTVVEVDRRRRGLAGERLALPGGIYLFERHVLERVATTGFQDIKQGLLEQVYASTARVNVHEVRGVSPRIIDLPTYTAVNSWLIGTLADRPALRAGYEQVGEAWVHTTARVHPTARLIGPVQIGPDAFVGPHAVIVGPSSIGAGSTVESSALVSRSIVWDGATIGAGALVDAALLADEATIAGGDSVRGTVSLGGETTVRPVIALPAGAARTLAQPLNTAARAF